MSHDPKTPDLDEEEPEKLKVTLYLSPKLVDLLDACKLEDQEAGLISRYMTRPRYLQRALQHYAELRRPPGTGEPYPRK